MIRARSIALAALLAACGEGGEAKPDFHGEPSENTDGRMGCIETVSAVSEHKSAPERKRAQAVLDRMLGAHTASLHWRDGETALTIEISRTQLLRVESREDPDFTLDVPRQCVDRMRIDAVVSLKTADGRLDERFSGVAFHVPYGDAGAGSEIEVLHAQTSRKAEELEGAYVRQTQGEGQLTAVYFSFDIDDKAFSGSISEETVHGDAVSMSAAFATWSKPWEQEPTMPQLTVDACRAMGGVPVFHGAHKSLCGERKTLGWISGDYIDGVYCCEVTPKFCWGSAVDIPAECEEGEDGKSRFYRIWGLCASICACEGPGCAESFDSLAACEAHYEGCDMVEYTFCGGLGGSTCAEDEYCSFLPYLACGAFDGNAVCLPRPTECDTDYAPVCTCGGKTYSNLCEANAAGYGISSFGACL